MLELQLQSHVEEVGLVIIWTYCKWLSTPKNSLMVIN
jgi:hypothetical protein